MVMDIRKCFLSALVAVLILACVHSTELDSTLLGAMDDYVLAVERERSSVDFTRDVDVSEPLEKRLSKFKSLGGSGGRTRYDEVRGFSGRGGFRAPVGGFVGPHLTRYGKTESIRVAGRPRKIHKELSLLPKERFELVDTYPLYEKRRPKIDFKALLKNLTKGAKKKTKAMIPLNKNLQAMNQIQFGILEAGAMDESINTEIIKKHIVGACNANQFMFARKMLGHEIYSSRKKKSSQRSRRSISSTRDILTDIKNKIGKDKYNRLMAYDGGVTLAFALDTTGSMVDDIDAAKTIVFGIVTQNRAFSVDYVLSPFNDPVSDPRHGPVTYMDKTEKYKFLELVSQVDEAGGGDCDELAISGIRDIFSSPLQYRSPIYVLTDAGPKDAMEEHLDVVKELIIEYKTPINFFLSNAGCLTNKAISVYKSLARYSGGQILYFSDKRQIASTTRFIQEGLVGGSRIPVTPSRFSKEGRAKRGIIAVEYSITVDDSVDVLSTSIMDRSNIDAQLYSPDGKRQVKGKLSTGKGALFLVDKPTPGVWKIKCPSCSWQSYVTSNSISLENIDFDYSFLVDVEIRGTFTAVPSSYPVKGKESTVIVTVPAHNRTKTSSYKLEVVNDALKTLHTISLQQYGRAPGRYKGSFPTPLGEFQLVLKGETKKAKPFKRLANGLIRPKSIVIHVFSASKGFVVKAGSKSPTELTFAIHCFNGKDTYDVKVHENKKFVAKKPRRVTCMPGRMSTFHVSFKAPGSAKKGNVHNVVVTVVSKKDGSKASKHVQLLII